MSPSLLQSTLFLLIPLFSTALLVLAGFHIPGPLKPQAVLAYIYIASVTLLATLAGALPLSHSSNSLSESLIQALLFLFIGIPVLDLAPTYVPHLSIRKLHTSILVITLSIATLSALISPFLPTATPLLYISPSLFLLYTIQSIARIAYILSNFLHPEEFNPPIPLALPSPALTASFPNDISKHHHKIPSVSTTSTITVVDRNRIPLPHQRDQLRSQIVKSRSRSLLVFILAVQVASLAANASALGVTISAGHNKPATLKTIQTVCTVLALIGSMSAYLLHTYNLQPGQIPTTTAASTAAHSNYNNLSTHSPDQLQMIESQQHSHSPMLIQLAPPPLARRIRANNQDVPIEKNLDTNAKAAGSDVELELDVVMNIGRYSMTLGRPSTASGKKKIQDSIDLGLRLVSSPACTPVPAALPIPLPLRVSVEEGSECSGAGFSALEKREKEKIQEYYLSSPSTGSPSSPFSPFERCGTETDPSSPDTPYPNTSGGNPDTTRDDSAINVMGHTLLRKRSSFFGWEFAWDQEALERADDAGKLKSAGGAGPVRRKSNLNPSTSKKPQLLVADQESFMDLPSPSLSRPHSFSAEAEVGGGGKMKRGVSWKSSSRDVEKMKGKNTLGLGIGIKPLRLSRSFGGTSNNSGGCRGVTGREMGHRTILSGDTGSMCGLGLKRKATALIGGQRSPVSPLAPSAVVSPRVMGQGNGEATRTTIATPVPTILERLKKTIPSHFTSASPSAGSENIQNNQAIGFIHSDFDNDELNEDPNAGADGDKDAELQKTPTIKSTRSYSQSPQSYRYSSPSSPNQQQRHEAESHHSSISEKTASTTTANTNSPQKLSPSLTRRGLSLKRSFKMGSTVGRTLGPGLTLSSAGLSCSPGSGPFPTSTSPYLSIRRCESEGLGFKSEEENREGKEKAEKNLDGEKIEKAEKIGKEDDDDVEAEMRSLGAAAGASYACATATATILAPVTGTDGKVDMGGGGDEFASRSGGDGSPIKTKTTFHSPRSLPTINITSTTAFSLPVCSTIVEQCQKQDDHNSLTSGAPWKPHPFVGWFRPSQTSTASRGDADIVSPEQELENITRSGIDRLSSLPPLPPIQTLLLPPMTPPKSQSLPPTPTKYRSTLLRKPSISNFKKRSAPPPGSSEWTHSMSTMSGMGGGGVSMVSLAHSRSHSISKSSSQPPSRSPTPKASMRLSAMNMGTVRNAFAGVGAKVSARMSSNSASTRGSAGIAAGSTVAPSEGMGIGMDNIDGDFMDLRDPFAPPPPSKLVSLLRGGDHTGGGSDFWVSGGEEVAEYDDDDSVEVGRMSSITRGKRKANMHAWGRLPMLPLPGSAPEASSGSVSLLAVKAHCHHGERRKYKKDKRAKVAAAAPAAGNGVLVERNSLHGYNLAYNAGEEDADFGFEEALLSQRLLRRLDSVEWD